MKALRIIWLVAAFIVLFPLIVVAELFWLVVCIRSAIVLEKPVLMGFKYWWLWLKKGIYMNADFVVNGL